MPLSVYEGAVVGAGMMFASAATFFYSRKKTLPFKVGHVGAWRAGQGELAGYGTRRLVSAVLRCTPL